MEFKLNYNYESSTLKELKEEISNEIQGTTIQLTHEYSDKDFTYLNNLIADLQEVCKPTTVAEVEKVKRLSHERFCRELNSELDIISESFKVGDYSQDRDGVSMSIITCNRGVYCKDKHEYALWINYPTRTILIYTDPRSKHTDKFIAIAKTHYENKGYLVLITSDIRWCG